MFDVGWAHLRKPVTPIEAGETVAIVVKHFGFWSMNAARIVYVVQEENCDFKKFGFAYGTLHEHEERGEERFVIEWNKRDDSVWYEMFAFSRPGPMGMMGYPLTRILQKRFARDSQRAMIRVVKDQGIK